MIVIVCKTTSFRAKMGENIGEITMGHDADSSLLHNGETSLLIITIAETLDFLTKFNKRDYDILEESLGIVANFKPMKNTTLM